MRKKILWLGLSFLLVAALMLTACPAPTVPGEEEEEEEEEEEVVPGEEEEEEEEVVPAVGAPVYGGTLTVFSHASGREPMAWDPSLGDFTTGWWAAPYAQYLTWGDVLNKGPRGTNEFNFKFPEYYPDEVRTGCLADSWEFLNDPLRLVFHIRPGVMWTGREGVMEPREVTAEDVAYSINRVYEAGKGVVTNILKLVNSVTAVGDTVVFELKFWHLRLYSVYKGTLECIIPPEVWEAGVNDWRNQVGTGPFILTDYIVGSRVVYERNPNYWQTTTINGKEYQMPFIDTMIWPIILDGATQIAALRTGKLDFHINVSAKYKETLGETCPELVKHRQLEAGTQSCLAFHLDEEPFDDIRCRQAVALAIDQEAIMKAVFLEGEVRSGVVWGWVPESVRTPLEKLPDELRELYECHPDKARALLADYAEDTGFSWEDFTTILTIRPYAYCQDVGSMIVSYLADVGISCKLNVVDRGTWYSHLYNHDWPAGGIFEHAGGSVPVLSLSQFTDPDISWNVGGVDDPGFTARLQKACEERDIDTRNVMGKELEEYYLKQNWYVPLAAKCFYTYHWPWVKNYYGEIDEGYYSMNQMYGTMWIDQSLKAEMGF